MVTGRTHHVRLKSLIEKEVGEESDQLEQCQRDHSTQRTDTKSQQRYCQQPGSGCEITQAVSLFLNGYSVLHNLKRILYRITMPGNDYRQFLTYLGSELRVM